MMRPQGFTLIEIIVALSVFAILGSIAFTGLNTVLNAQYALAEKNQHIVELQLSFKYMERDLKQALARTIRDQYGDFQPMFSSDGDQIMAFTYSGVRNPAQQARSAMQRVAYQFESDQLVRHNWNQLDGATEVNARELVLINDLEYLEWQFLNHDNDWINQWPPINLEPTAASLPRAVMLTVNSPSLGDIARIFTLPQ